MPLCATLVYETLHMILAKRYHKICSDSEYIHICDKPQPRYHGSLGLRFGYFLLNVWGEPESFNVSVV